MKRNIKEIEGVGPVLFQHSKRARNLNISIKPFRDVRVTVPSGYSFRKAEEIFYSKTGWIKKHLERFRQAEKEHKSLAKSSNDIDKTSAKKKLVKRLRELAEKHAFSFNKVFIKNQKTRWGSCSEKNNINLNMKLMLLPENLIDYVILHELVHLQIKSHNKEFWTELNRFTGNSKAIDKKLNKYRLEFL